MNKIKKTNYLPTTSRGIFEKNSFLINGNLDLESQAY